MSTVLRKDPGTTAKTGFSEEETEKPNVVATANDLLAQRKAELEVEKLTAEIQNLRSNWWKPAAIQATPGAILVLATLTVALYTGLLDAKRDRNTAGRPQTLISR